MNALAKMFHVRTTSVLKWIRKFAKEHYGKPDPDGKAIIMELDEMWHYVKKTFQTLDNVTLYYTDKWEAYASVLPADKLTMDKGLTHEIERNNCRNRHWFGRFKRRSIVVSKSVEMVDLTMALFARFRVNGDASEIFKLVIVS